MTNFAWFPATGDGQSQATAFAWNTGAFPFATGADWLNVDAEPLPLMTGTVPAAVSGGVPQDSAFLVAGQGIGSMVDTSYHPNPAKGDPFIAAGADGNYDFPTDVVLNSGSVALNTLGLEQANVGGSFAPTLDIEGAALDVAGSVLSLYSPSLLPPGPGSFVANAGLFSVPDPPPQPGGTIEIGNGGTLEVGGSLDAAVQFNAGSGNVLKLDSAALPFGGEIFDFTIGDTIDLPGVTFGPAAGAAIAYTNGAPSALDVDGSFGQLLTFPLGASPNNDADTLLTRSDGAGGTDIFFSPPVPFQLLSDNGQSSRLVGYGGTDVFLCTTGNDTIATGIVYSLIEPGSGNDVIFDESSSVVFPDTGGTETVFASGPLVAAVGAGKMTLVNGEEQSTVFGGGSGSATINGGVGGGLFAGGTGGENVIVGGFGPCTMFGSSGSDLLMAGGARANLLIAGSGNETLTGIGSIGGNVMYAGAGNDLLGGGAGKETFFASQGSATVIGGTGADLYAFVNGLAGGTETVFGFNTGKGDAINLQGYGANEAQNDLANAVVAGGNTTLTLSDQTQVTFVGVTGLNASAFV